MAYPIDRISVSSFGMPHLLRQVILCTDMDPRLSQSIYFLFRASREEGYKAGTRFHAEHTTKLRWSSLTPRHLASSSLSWQSEGKVPKVDRQSICNTKFDGSHNDLAAKKQIDVRPKDTRRLLSSFTGSVQGVSLKTQHSHIHYGSLSGPIRFSSTSAASAASGKTTGYKGIKDPSDITQNRYNQLADDYLEAVQQWLEDLSDADENVEVEFSVSESPIGNIRCARTRCRHQRQPV